MNKTPLPEPMPAEWAKMLEEMRTGHTPIHGLPPVSLPEAAQPTAAPAPAPVAETKTPSTPWSIKLAAAAATALTLLGGAFVVNVTVAPKSPGGDAHATQPAQHAAPTVTVQQPKVEVLSRAEIEQIAAIASNKASERLALELENRRRSERELMDAKLGRIDDKLDSLRELLQDIRRQQRRRER